MTSRTGLEPKLFRSARSRSKSSMVKSAQTLMGLQEAVDLVASLKLAWAADLAFIEMGLPCILPPKGPPVHGERDSRQMFGDVIGYVDGESRYFPLRQKHNLDNPTACGRHKIRTACRRARLCSVISGSSFVPRAVNNNENGNGVTNWSPRLNRFRSLTINHRGALASDACPRVFLASAHVPFSSTERAAAWGSPQTRTVHVLVVRFLAIVHVIRRPFHIVELGGIDPFGLGFENILNGLPGFS